MLAALVELLFFFPPFFSSFLFPSCGLFVSRKCGAALEIPSRAEKHRNFCRRRRRRRRYRRSEFNYALIILPIERNVFIDPSPHFSFIDDFFFFDTTKKKRKVYALFCYFDIYLYIYSKDTDGNPASREPFLNEGRGLFGFSRVRMDRLEFKGCARRSPIGVAPTGARLIATHAPLLLRL